MRIFTNRRWASALAITAFVGAIPVVAQTTPVTVYGEPSEVRTERVSYRDLNLATRDGEKILTQRVGSAVRRVCSDTGHIGLYNDRFYCTSGAWKDARPQMSRAIARAREIALYGKSSIAMTAITVKIR